MNSCVPEVWAGNSRKYCVSQIELCTLREMQLLTQKPFHTFNTFNSSTNNNWVKNTFCCRSEIQDECDRGVSVIYGF